MTIIARCGSLVAALALASTVASDEWTHPYRIPQPAEFPDEFIVVVEIGEGGSVKYEVDRATGRLFVDRFPGAPVKYPVNYGSIPSTLQEDGDPLDALVLTREPILPGALIRVRPVALMKMVDRAVSDDKVVAVPVSRVDPTYDNVNGISGLPSHWRARLDAFFRTYKQLPPAGGVVEVTGWEERDAARALMRRTTERYSEKR
jgi:inorganic pyrophosphatase